MNQRIWLLFITIFTFQLAIAQGHDNDQTGHDQDQTEHVSQDGHEHDADQAHSDDHDDHGSCGMHHDDTYNPGGTAFHHISDQNVFSIGPVQIPLPCMLYTFDDGLKMFSSSKFHSDTHGNGEYAHDGWILYNGVVKRITDPGFPMGEVELGHHKVFYQKEEVDGKSVDRFYACYNDQLWPAESESTIDGGLFGGGMTSFIDFSITKNVVTMILTLLICFLIFRSVRNAYTTRDGQAPSGLQGFMEPIFVFMRDEVMVPFIGPKYEKYLPFVMSIFFSILFLNLIGQVPFLGNANVTGQLAFTMVIAVFAFLVTNLSGNGHYWQHVFWMPGLPIWVKVLVTPVEIIGLFLKPITLMLRLFGNITAGHMVIVIFVGLIFVFGNSGQNMGAGIGAVFGSGILSMFMMAIELLVAFIQAFVFALLTASYIGAAVEEVHH
ncbi:MAG: F0F1 ATP synthase subunit A [Bacteroidia bacterium]|nr:F0F1 ATP synthase subunit A [Bacteroidia bacterium]